MSAISTPHVIGKRYQLLNRLGQGGMGVVYRATDNLTGKIVALKQVTSPSERLIFASRTDDTTDVRLSLANEFKTLATLRHPFIISVLDYGFDAERQPYFTMDLLENAQTIVAAAQKCDLKTRLELLTQVLQALVYLHRRNILHRDLKPGNVMVVDEQAKVLDFGLSLKHGDMASTSGTVAYMAPEFFQEIPASEASDLYAVGILAYEIFAGRHPFSIDNLTTLIDGIQNSQPDQSALDAPPGVVAVILRLLAKRPEERYPNANEVIQALWAASGLASVVETAATRESFLQAAQFVGREVEFAQLSDVLSKVIGGSGDAWLVGGESGIGKSRLLDELRTLALVQGALVLTGQAVTEGQSPYQLWHYALRLMVLLTDLNDADAAVLKSLVPEIEALLKRPVPDPPPTTPQLVRERLLGTVESLFTRQSRPVIVILEDLHWADEESLALLARLTQNVSVRPLLLLGSYRDDERPALPTDLPKMHTLKLSRLSGGAIAELSESMLGSAGRQQNLIDLLQRETEGNVFFLVEVMRALAEEAGQLDKVGASALPEHVSAGGVRQIIQRRLSRVQADDYPLLRTAAVAGRQLDLALLRGLNSTDNLDQWLDNCATAAVLNVQEGVWRFAHDKLREGLLADLSAQEQRQQHRRIAEAMHKLYGSAPQYAAVLAFHFLQGEVWDQAVKFLIQAGDAAMRLNATAEARQHFGNTLQALTHLPDSEENRYRRVDTTIKLASVSFATDDPAQNIARLTDAETLLKQLPDLEGKVNRTRLARIHFWMGRCHYYRGAMREAIGYYRQVLGVAQESGDEELLAIPSMAIARVMCVQGYYNKAEVLLKQTIPLLEKVANWPEWISAVGFLGTALSARGDYREGVVQAELSQRRAQDTNNLAALALTHLYAWWVHFYARNIDQMIVHNKELLTLAQQSGDRLYIYVGYNQQAMIDSLQANHKTARENVERAKTTAQNIGSRLILADVFGSFEAQIISNAGSLDEAVERAEKAAAFARSIGGVIAEALANRAWGQALSRLNPPQWEQAEAHLTSSIQGFETGGIFSEMAHTNLLWGTLCREQGIITGARDHLTKAAKHYESFDRGDLFAQAQKLLADLPE